MIRKRLPAKSLMAFGCLAMLLSGCQGAGESPRESVVFDIDGTLTPDPYEATAVRPHAADAVWSYVRNGYAVIYVTGRVKLQESSTVDYLRNNGFPDCPLYTNYGNPLDQVLSPSQVVLYKTQTLFSLIETEHRSFQFGYGDSTTDFESYSAAFIPSAHIFALLRSPGGVWDVQCQPGDYPAENCLQGYTDKHLSYIRDLTPVNEGMDNMCGSF